MGSSCGDAALDVAGSTGPLSRAVSVVCTPSQSHLQTHRALWFAAGGAAPTTVSLPNLSPALT
jgi:hypothetical protein